VVRTSGYPHQGFPIANRNVRDAVRISQTTGPGRSGWMAAPRSATLGLAFDLLTYRTLLNWHLGISLVPFGLWHTCGHLWGPHGLLQTEQALVRSWKGVQGSAIDVGVVHPNPPGADHITPSAAATILSNCCLRKEVKYAQPQASRFSLWYRALGVLLPLHVWRRGLPLYAGWRHIEGAQPAPCWWRSSNKAYHMP
jgi:hypothetical protein